MLRVSAEQLDAMVVAGEVPTVRPASGRVACRAVSVRHGFDRDDDHG
jgi:hypothetical protein